MTDTQSPLEIERHGSRLQVRLVGAQELDGVVRLGALNKLTQMLLKTLAAIESDVHDGKTTTYRVLGFQYGSPGQLELESAPETPTDTDYGNIVFPTLTEQINAINSGQMPTGASYNTLEQIQGLAGLSKYYELLEFRNGKAPATIEPRTALRVKVLLSNVVQSYGTFRGRLDAVNIHNDPCNATLYPLVGPSRVKCVFAKAALPNLKIGGYLGKPVEVHGRMRFYAGEPHPFEIQVEHVESLENPTTGIIGCMIGLTGDLTTLEYLGKLRDDEDDA
jgi:hypothetical protein